MNINPSIPPLQIPGLAIALAPAAGAIRTEQVFSLSRLEVVLVEVWPDM
jgi:hypothetical protein